MESLLPIALVLVVVGLGTFIAGVVLSLTPWGRVVPPGAATSQVEVSDPWWKRLVEALAKAFTYLVLVVTGKGKDVPRYAVVTSAGLLLVVLGCTFALLALLITTGGGPVSQPTPSPSIT